MSAEKVDSISALKASIESNNLTLQPPDFPDVFQYYPASEASRITNEEGLTFTAFELINLTDVELSDLSRFYYKNLTKFASRKGVKIHNQTKRDLLDIDESPLSHEMCHIRKLLEFRNIDLSLALITFFLIDSREGIQVALFTNPPPLTPPLTDFENLLVTLAPKKPSGADYKAAIKLIEKIEAESQQLDWATLHEVLKTKARGRGRAVIEQHFGWGT
jgi:hypothetical protein